ncbi:MAG: hypothetical protein EPO40_03030 [Myxococcaceae bacterium]|nr:MAG: hypothetical protein EPO40_03030 [Myxococcaceae bacterium]
MTQTGPGTGRDDVCSTWLGAQDSAETVATYRHVISRWFAWCDAQPLDVWAARPRDVNRWKQSLRRKLSGRTVGKYLSALSSFYRHAIRDAEDQPPIAANPAADVRRPRVAKEPHGDALTAAEAHALRTASLADPRTAALVHLLLTGIRVSEACGAKVRDLGWDGDDRALTITRKGGHKDLVVIDADDWAVIQHYLQTRSQGPGGWLFATQRGQMTRRTAYGIVRSLAAKTLERDVVIGTHDIRRTVITLAFDEGMPAQEVRGLAGHSSIATTQMYDRNVHTRGRGARAAVKAALARQDGT